MDTAEGDHHTLAGRLSPSLITPEEADHSHSHPDPADRRRRFEQFLTTDSPKRLVCAICSRRFRGQEHLERHYRSLHTQDKLFECNECGKKFSGSDNLVQHARTHGNGPVVVGILETGAPPPLPSYDEEKEEEEGKYTIKCICIYRDDDGSTVYCPKCDTWQHIECYYHDEEVPEEHLCVDCVPRDLDGRKATERQRRARQQPRDADRRVKQAGARNHGSSQARRSTQRSRQQATLEEGLQLQSTQTASNDQPILNVGGLIH